MRIELRDYQNEAVQAIYDWFDRGRGDAPLIVAPTGAGKSVILAEFMRRAHGDFPGTRIMLATHQKELIEQDYRALLRIWPEAPAGIYSAGLGQRRARATMLFAGVQSVHRRAAEIGHVDLILIDEAHLVPRSADTQYGRLIEGLRGINPALKVVGLTATPFRLDSGRLDRGRGALFDGIAYDIPIPMLVERGYLSPLISKRPGTVFDTRGLHTRAGEWVEAEMAARFATDEITRAAVAEIMALGSERRSWLLFCISVEHAAQVRDELRRLDVPAAMVTGDTPSGERARILADFKAGRLRAVTNVNVLTTGFDAPATDLLAFLRPTQSLGLYMQMAGRGMRPAPGKANCIAEGQRVLTDRGLVQIERVTTEMKVWDGCSFVRHDGIVFRGQREVIEYAGLVATADHRVWTEEGWKTLGECAVARTPIAVTGNGRSAIWTSEGRFRRDRAEGREGQAARPRGVRRLWRAVLEGLHQLAQGDGRVPEVREPALCTAMAGHALHCGQAAMHEPQGSALRGLRRAWNSLRVLGSDRNGRLDSGEPWPLPGERDRPHRQQRPLRSGQSALGVLAGAKQEQTPETDTVRVYDIVNAGPLNRFTIEGLLVHNCLVLDFASNVARHGPVDAVSATEGKAAREKGDREEPGDTPAKVCPGCQSILWIGARECPDCGHAFPEPAPKIERTASTEAIMNLTAEDDWSVVQDFDVGRHEKNGTASLRVRYLVAGQPVSEFVCFEHTGFARQKAVAWWHRMAGTTPPETVADALARATEIRVPTEAVIRKEGDWWRVARTRGERTRMAA